MDSQRLEALPPDVAQVLEADRSIPPLPTNARRLVDAKRSAYGQQPAHAAKAKIKTFPRHWARPAVMCAAAVLAAAVAIAVVWKAGGPTPSAGGLADLSARQTFHIGTRALGVAEPGSSLRWQVDGSGATTVHQHSGSVFYRVNTGDRFRVITTIATITVTGTSFRVEHSDASSGVRVTVSVYEGRVVLSNELGRTELSPGMRAEALRDGAPSSAADFLTAARTEEHQHAQLFAEQAGKIQRLQARIEKLETHAGTAGMDSQENVGPTRAYYRPSQDDLEEMAADCRLKFDAPPLDAHDAPPLLERLEASASTRFDLSESEREAIQAMYEGFNEAFTARIRELYIEATGDTAGAAVLSLGSMMAEIVAKSDPQAAIEARRKIAEERAGLRPRHSGDHFPVEAYYRTMIALGTDLENKLAQIVGADRAQRIRESSDGWPAKMSVGACK